MTTKETAIKFALWLREVDTQERADEWFGYSDGDMYDYFIENVFISSFCAKKQIYEM